MTGFKDTYFDISAQYVDLSAIMILYIYIWFYMFVVYPRSN